MTLIATVATAAAGCAQKQADFKYTVDQFADVKIIRYTIPGWDELTLNQKAYAYHLSEAAKWGRDILWEQNCCHNMQLRHALEDILNNYKGDRKGEDWQAFELYAKRVFFANGIHHHYAEDKIFPTCSEDYFKSLLDAVGRSDEAEVLLPYAFDPNLYPQRRCTSSEGDIVAQSGVNYYEGVTREEVEAYYASIEDKNDPTPIAYGLNTKLVKENGKVVEKPWKKDGLCGKAIEKICEELAAASEFADNESQKRQLALLIDYYTTGDLRTWDEFNVEWVKDTVSKIDFVNGFIEDYNDPLGRKGAWEGHVNIKDEKASERTEILSKNAQWFEDNAPIDERFKKSEVKGVTAKVIDAVCLSGDAYPATPIGINLPNADWIRRDHGSKSVTIANITHAYDYSAEEQPKSVLKEFAYSEEEIARAKQYGSYASEIHTDLHECLGHGSGQLLPGVSSTAMGEFSSTLEEARADLFGLYFSADPKMVELGIMPDPEAYKAEYDSYIRNGLMVQFNRIELGRQNTEAHMQNRKLIAEWCYENGQDIHWCDDEGCRFINVIEKVEKDGKTYFTITNYEALRELFADLLAEIQRIKSEGDYEAGKALVETYAVNIDPEIHKEVLERYASLDLKPYGGFLNPDIVPVIKDGAVVDYVLEYPDSFLGQMLKYGANYSAL
ncbi:MAG: dihydrofolate reductase [Bacteroidales bacterium]|nr:dihydrofolate reductase [Candidatus Cryptobacteroides choladohippi]